jgi:hypothetical protein
MDAKEKQSMLLMQLVVLFQSTALQHMGKLKNPMTDVIERDLQQAQISIDMIAMLQDRMKGNLSEEEERMLSSVLRDLRLNYVDEVNKPAAPPVKEQTP